LYVFLFDPFAFLIDQLVSRDTLAVSLWLNL
jgi:hypothetical protein